MSGAVAALFVAFMTGFGVYRSCTAHQSIRQQALAIDAVGAVLMTAIFYWGGFFS